MFAHVRLPANACHETGVVALKYAWNALKGRFGWRCSSLIGGPPTGVKMVAMKKDIDSMLAIKCLSLSQFEPIELTGASMRLSLYHYCRCSYCCYHACYLVIAHDDNVCAYIEK